MNKQFYFRLSSFIFFLAGLLHLWRGVNGWELWLGPHLIPSWISWLAVFITLCLAYFGNKFTTK